MEHKGRTGMRVSKSGIVKALLYIVPAAVISWWFLYMESAPAGSMGGGSYNMNGLAHALALVAWSVTYTILMLLGTAIGLKNTALLKENLIFCGLGVLALLLSAVYLASYLG